MLSKVAFSYLKRCFIYSCSRCTLRLVLTLFTQFAHDTITRRLSSHISSLFLTFQAVENEASFDSFAWGRKSHCIYPLLTNEPAVLEYNLLYNVSHVEKGRRLNVGLRVRTPSLGHLSCVSLPQGELTGYTVDSATSIRMTYIGRTWASLPSRGKC